MATSYPRLSISSTRIEPGSTMIHALVSPSPRGVRLPAITLSIANSHSSPGDESGASLVMRTAAALLVMVHSSGNVSTKKVSSAVSELSMPHSIDVWNPPVSVSAMSMTSLGDAGNVKVSPSARAGTPVNESPLTAMSMGNPPIAGAGVTPPMSTTFSTVISPASLELSKVHSVNSPTPNSRTIESSSTSGSPSHSIATSKPWLSVSLISISPGSTTIQPVVSPSPSDAVPLPTRTPEISKGQSSGLEPCETSLLTFTALALLVIVQSGATDPT